MANEGLSRKCSDYGTDDAQNAEVFQSKCLVRRGGTGGGGLPNRKTRKTSGIANWKEMVTKHAILSGCEQNRC